MVLPIHLHLDGEKVVVSGIVSCETMGSIDLDFRTPDPLAEGGMKGQGKITFGTCGVFSLENAEGNWFGRNSSFSRYTRRWSFF